MKLAPTRSKAKQRWSLQPLQLATVRDSVARATGLRIDTARLGLDEQAELVELVRKISADAEPDVGRDSPSYLDERDRKRYETLVERAADTPGHFARQREESAMRTKLRRLAHQANQPPARPRWEERGAIVLPQYVFDWFRDGIFYVEHAGMLVFVLAQFENGAALAPGSYFEEGGDVLVVNAQLGLGVRFFDEDGRVGSGWRRYLDHLAGNRWLLIESNGSELRIRRGPRALQAILGRAS